MGKTQNTDSLPSSRALSWKHNDCPPMQLQQWHPLTGLGARVEHGELVILHLEEKATKYRKFQSEFQF